MLPIASLPTSHHRQKPGVKQLFPPQVVARDPGRQRPYPVFPVPFGQTGQIIFYRCIIGNTIGIDIAANIPVPQLQALFLRIQGDAVHHPLGHRSIIEAKRISLPVFRPAGHRVEPEIIAPVHKLFCFQRLQLFRFAQYLVAEAILFQVGMADRLAYLYLRYDIAEVQERPFHTLFFADLGTEAKLTESDQYQLKVEVSAQIAILLDGLPQGQFVLYGEVAVAVVVRFYKMLCRHPFLEFLLIQTDYQTY